MLSAGLCPANLRRTKMNNINALCKKALKVTDEELAELTDVARSQLEHCSPLKQATTARQQALGHHNMLVLTKVRELRDTIKNGESLARHND